MFSSNPTDDRTVSKKTVSKKTVSKKTVSKKTIGKKTVSKAFIIIIMLSPTFFIVMLSVQLCPASPN